MSGIVGIVQTDEAPVDRPELERLTASLTPRAPDGCATRLLGNAGLGHALLRTDVPVTEPQPLSVDRQLWIVADARLDDRADLVRSLRNLEPEVPDAASDAELILRAYACWGEGCVEHFLGDFAFAIWDLREQKLFCARDPLGIKPLFYSRRSNLLVFSNDLNTVRLHPLVGAELDERVVGEHLVLGNNIRPEATFFADVRCLSPGHTLVLRRGDLRHRRTFTICNLAPLRYRKSGEYVEHFRQLFDTAVRDRMPAGDVGVLMSGGLDSTSIAATAARLQRQDETDARLRLWTFEPEGNPGREEREHADLVGRVLSASHHYLREAEYALYHRYQPRGVAPAAVEGPFAGSNPLILQGLARECRVALMGHNDDVFRFAQEYVRDGLRSLRVGGLAGDFLQYRRLRGHLPRLGLLRNEAKRRLYRWGWRRTFPCWLNPDFERRLRLRDRWEEVWREGTRSLGRVEAYLQSRTYFFPHVLEALDPGQTCVPVEVRHPLADLRLVRFLLSIPAVPWCVDRLILREAMRGRLPERVRLRPKVNIPMPQRMSRHLQRDPERWKRCLRTAPGFQEYVSIREAEKAIEELRARNFAETYLILAPLSLAFWLNRLRV